MEGRVKRWLAVAIVLVALQACTSAAYLSPILRPGDTEIDSAIVGDWIALDKPGFPGTDTVRIRLLNFNVYRVETIFDSSTSRWSHYAQLGRFEGLRLLELTAMRPAGAMHENEGMFLALSYFFIIDSVSPTQLLLRYPDTEKLARALEAEPGLTPHAKADDIDVLLTGDTAEMRRFLGLYLKRPGVIVDSLILVRAGTARTAPAARP